MYEELVGEFELKKAQGVIEEQREQRIGTVTKDLTKYKNAVITKERYITAFKRELNNIVSAMLTGKELEESVRLLYRKYVRNETTGDSTIKVSERALSEANTLRNIEPDDDMSVNSHQHGGGGKQAAFKLEVEEALVDAAKESERQKEFASRGVASLKMRLDQSQKEGVIMAKRRLNENSNLLFEVNNLRAFNKRLELQLLEKNEQIKEYVQRIQRGVDHDHRYSQGSGAAGGVVGFGMGVESQQQSNFNEDPSGEGDTFQRDHDGGGSAGNPRLNIGGGPYGGQYYGDSGPSATPNSNLTAYRDRAGGGDANGVTMTDTVTRTGTPSGQGYTTPNPFDGAMHRPGSARPPSPGTAPVVSGVTGAPLAGAKKPVGVGLDGRNWLKHEALNPLNPNPNPSSMPGNSTGTNASNPNPNPRSNLSKTQSMPAIAHQSNPTPTPNPYNNNNNDLASLGSRQGITFVHGGPAPTYHANAAGTGTGMTGTGIGSSSRVSPLAGGTGSGVGGGGRLLSASASAGGGVGGISAPASYAPPPDPNLYAGEVSSSLVFKSKGVSGGSGTLRTPSERTVEKLRGEAEMLARQLDDVGRERDNYRVQNSQLRKQVQRLAQSKGLPSGGGGAFELDRMGDNTFSFRLGGNDDNFDLESDAAAGSLVISGKEERRGVAQDLTHADVHGRPSREDLKDLALGPAPAARATGRSHDVKGPLAKAKGTKGGKKGPQGKEFVDLPPLPHALNANSSIESLAVSTDAGKIDDDIFA